MAFRADNDTHIVFPTPFVIAVGVPEAAISKTVVSATSFPSRFRADIENQIEPSTFAMPDGLRRR